MKFIITTLLVIFTCVLNAQVVDLYGGPNLTQLFTIHKVYGHDSFDSKRGFGGTVGLGFQGYYNSGKKKGRVLWRTEIEVNYARNYFRTYSGGNGGGNALEVNAHFYQLAMTYYPFNLRLRDRFYWNFGFRGATYIYDVSEGKLKIYRSGMATEESIHDLSNSPYRKFSFGCSSQLIYEIPLNKKVTIMFQYAYHLGLISKTKIGDKNSHHFAGIGVRIK